MSCMEVWGGNREADIGVNMLGLDTWVYCRPHGGAVDGGGDVHYMSSCASGSITRVLLADVSGHGHEVSHLAEGLRGIMQNHVNRIDQRAVLMKVNDQFRDVSTQERFATAVMLTYFAPTASLTISNAGHPPPLLYRQSDKTWRVFDAGQPKRGEGYEDMPLGILEDVNYNQSQTRLDSGDRLLCYSDALIEARLPDGKLLGVNGLLNITQSIPLGPPSEMLTALRERLQQKANLEGDDVTAILIQRDAQPARVPVGRVVTAPARILWTKLKNRKSTSPGSHEATS